MANIIIPDVSFFANLIPMLQNAPIINGILQQFHSSFTLVFEQIKQDFDMLNIDNCSGEYLDNLGALVGIARATRKTAESFLTTDDLYDSLDNSVHYVKNASVNEGYRLVNDDVYRKMIKSQIIRNNYTEFSINDFERIALLILNEDLKEFRIDSTPSNKQFNITVTTDNSMSHFSRAFLQSKSIDNIGRLTWDFPWPPRVKTVKIEVV